MQTRQVAHQLRHQTMTEPPPSCPVCALAFAAGTPEHELSGHVNRCLDGGPADDEAPPLVRSSSAPAVQSSLLSFMTRRSGSTPASTPTATTPKPGSVEEKEEEEGIEDDDNGRGDVDVRSPARRCPFYKWIPGTTITVDAFNYGRLAGCTAYFLSHFHSDHYGGLSSTFSHGKIYCSSITASLVASQLRVSPTHICPLELDRPHVVDGDVRVTLIEANHCPGAVLFLFELPDGASYLHTGDFRASPRMLQHAALKRFATWSASAPPDDAAPLPSPAKRSPMDVFRAWAPQAAVAVADQPASLRELVQKTASPLLRVATDPSFSERDRQMLLDMPRGGAARLTGLFLDTTYCRPSYVFPPQERVIAHVLETVRACLADNKRTLFLVGSYQIGKERVFLAIAEMLKCRIYADARKRAMLAKIGDAHLASLLTDDSTSSNLHVLHMGAMNAARLSEYLKMYASQWTSLVAFRPTGWTHRGGADVELTRPAVHGCVKIFGLPYSEHSSFLELECFVRSLRPTRVIPTVNVGAPAERAAMQAHFDAWLG